MKLSKAQNRIINLMGKGYWLFMQQGYGGYMGTGSLGQSDISGIREDTKDKLLREFKIIERDNLKNEDASISVGASFYKLSPLGLKTYNEQKETN